MTDATLFAAYAADRRLAALAADLRPAFVWSLDGRVLYWSNRAGAALLGVAFADIVGDAATLVAASLAPQIAAVGRGLARVDATRIERLRFPGLARLEALACACRLFDGPNGSRAVQVTALEVPRWLRQRPAERESPVPVPATDPIADPPSRPGAWTWVPFEPQPDTPVPGGSVPPPIQRKPRTVPLRFVFQTDADGHFTVVSPELGQAIGAANGEWRGKRFAEIAALAGADPDGPVGIALASRDTWTGLAVDWHDQAAGEVVTIEMSALPVFDRERSFQGFRGFGICRPPVTVPASDRRVAEPSPSPAVPAPRAGAAVADAVLIPEDDEVSDVASRFSPDNDRTGDRPAAAEAALPEPPAAPAEPAVPPRAIIDLSGVREARSPTDPKVVRLHSRPPGQERPALSPSERSAFREIAKALGARVEGEDATPTAPAELPPLPPLPPSPDTKSLHADAPEATPSQTTAASAAGQLAPPPGEPAGDGPGAAIAGGAEERDWITDRSVDAADPLDPIEAARARLAADQRRPRLVEPEAAPLPSEPGLPVALVDRLPIGVLVARGDRLLFANRTLLDLLGYETLAAVEAAGGLERLFAGRDLAPAEEGEDGCQGVRLIMADGQTLSVEARIQSMVWGGEGALLVSVRRALSSEAGERVRAAEGATAAAERRAAELQAVLDTATDGVVILDGDGRIVGINRSAEALFGYEVGEIAGKGMLLLFAPESHRAAFDYLDSLKANGVASVLNDGREVMGRVRQGGLVPLFMTIGRLGDVEGNRFCAVLRDLTSFKKAESELLGAKRQAEIASSQKSDFLAKISHEIRTPLSAIIGFAEVMMEERFGPIGNERYRTYARDIHASGGHVVSLVNDLLDLSKIEAGKLDLTFTSVSLNDIVQQSVAIMQPQANRDRIIIRTALAAGLPNVVADDRSVRQIALNLLSNSIKFTMPGGQVIVSTTMSEKGEAVLRVRDTGVGMTEKELAVAMEPFRQVSTSSHGGTGLGLPLTKALVEANRASFAIQSTKNAGTIVEVVFPATRVLAE